MPVTSAAGLPYPAASDGPNGPLQIQNLAQSLDTLVIPKFVNVAARDAAIPSPVQGQACHVAAQVSPTLPARLMVYSNSMWRLVGPSPLRAVVAPWTESAGQFGPSPSTLTSLVIPDPGFPYRLSAIAHCNLGAPVGTTGTRWDLWLRTTGGGVANLDMDYNVAVREEAVFQRIVTNVTDQIYTGSCTVIAEARRAYGSANGFIDANNRRLHVNQHAA